MAKPKKPKLLSTPKMPKQSASAEVWDRYSKKLDSIRTENTKRLAAYNQKLKAWNKSETFKETVKKKAASLKGLK